MKNNTNDKGQPQTVDVKNTAIGSMFAQIVGVTVTDFDITFEFVYQHPNPDIKQAQVVSRVTMPRNAGEGLARVIANTIKAHEKKKKEN